MKRLLVYVDASVVGGCEDEEFSEDSLKLWDCFRSGLYIQLLSEHTLREIRNAPPRVRARIEEISDEHQAVVPDSEEAESLAQAYLDHGIVGPGSRADALHVALATVGGADVLLSWNFKHIVTLDRIRLYNAVNLEQGYGLIEIRTPKEVLIHEDENV